VGIPWWKSALFFVSIAVFGIALFPSQRETGKLFSETGSLDKARFYLEKQFHRDPADLANTVRYLDSLRYHNEDIVFERSVKRLERLFAGNLEFLDVVARFYEDNYDYGKACKYWFEMLKIDPNLKDIREKLISTALLSKDFAHLIGLYNFEISRGYAGPEDYYALARLYSLERNSARARDIYERLLGKYPEESNAKVLLADIYEVSGEPDKAIALYGKLINGSPDNINYALKYIDLLIKAKKDNEAMEALEIFSRRFSSDSRFVRLLSDMYVKLGKRKEAIGLLEELYRRDPENYIVLKSLGDLYMDTRDYEKALEVLNAYNEKTGGDYHSHHVLGDVLSAMGDKTGGEREYREALGLIRRENR